MKKVLLLNALLVLCGLSLNAQIYVPFPNHDARWSEVYRPHGDSAWRMRYYALKNSDTVINSTSYHKVYISADTVFDENEYYAAIREDNQMVYKYMNGNETLLYDFTVQEGDTLAHNANNGHNNWNLDLVVTSVDSVQIGGIYRRRISLGIPNGPTANFYSSWVDGIGNLMRGVMFSSGTYPLNGMWNELVCFKQDNTLLWEHTQGWMFGLTFANCDLLIQDVEETANNTTAPLVVPNPVSGTSYFMLDKRSGFENLVICDVLGRKMMSANVRNMEKVPIDGSRLHAGVYSYVLTGSNGQKASGKFVVE